MKSKSKLAHGSDPETALNLSDIGADLASELNHYVTATEDMPDMTGAEVGVQLAKMLSTETIEFFLEQGDVGRGYLMGLANGVFALEYEVDKQLAERTALYGGDEDAVPDEEIEDVIHSGLKNGRHGGGSDGKNH